MSDELHPGADPAGLLRQLAMLADESAPPKRPRGSRKPKRSQQQAAERDHKIAATVTDSEPEQRLFPAASVSSADQPGQESVRPGEPARSAEDASLLAEESRCLSESQLADAGLVQEEGQESEPLLQAEELLLRAEEPPRLEAATQPRTSVESGSEGRAGDDGKPTNADVVPHASVGADEVELTEDELGTVGKALLVAIERVDDELRGSSLPPVRSVMLDPWLDHPAWSIVGDVVLSALRYASDCGASRPLEPMATMSWSWLFRRPSRLASRNVGSLYVCWWLCNTVMLLRDLMRLRAGHELAPRDMLAYGPLDQDELESPRAAIMAKLQRKLTERGILRPKS